MEMGGAIPHSGLLSRAGLLAWDLNLILGQDPEGTWGWGNHHLFLTGPHCINLLSLFSTVTCLVSV